MLMINRLILIYPSHKLPLILCSTLTELTHFPLVQKHQFASDPRPTPFASDLGPKRELSTQMCITNLRWIEARRKSRAICVAPYVPSNTNHEKG